MSDIILDNVFKTYGNGKARAVSGVSFQVGKGEMFGLIGPDGAGKTTLFRILTTLLLPDSGSASVNGYDVVKDYRSIRRTVGYMPGKFSLYQDLTVEENLNFFATVFNTTVAENYDLIKDIYIQIEPFKNRRAGQLSGGMKQKLALSCALIHRPEVLFLDEPTTGVDAVSRIEFWGLLKRLRQKGITILVSTPYMDEAAMCEKIALIQEGLILTVDTPDNISAQFSEDLYAARSENMSKLLKDLRNNDNVQSCYSFGEYHHLTFSNAVSAKQELTGYLVKECHHQNLELKQVIPSIEDCFMKLMEHPRNSYN